MSHRGVVSPATGPVVSWHDIRRLPVGRPRAPGRWPDPSTACGKESVNELAAALSEREDVDAVLASDTHAIDE
jgi:hypothetical protein